MRIEWTVCLALATATGAASCAKAPDAPGPEAAAAGDAAGNTTQEEPGETKSEPGVMDAIDYGIGKKQIEMKKRIESELDDIRRTRSRELEEALGE